MLVDYDALLLGLWKMFNYYPKKGSILGPLQQIYGKKPLKILKAATTRWLTHGKSSERVLECFRELSFTLDQICTDTNESEARGNRRMIMEHKLIFCLCFMTDIMSIINKLSLTLQKQAVLFVDINHYVAITLAQLHQLMKTDNPEAFSQILSPKQSYYGEYQIFLDIISNFRKAKIQFQSDAGEIHISNFHNTAKPLIEVLVKEIEQAFDVVDFPVLDAFHPFHPRNVPDKPLPSFGQEEAEIIFKHYGNSKVDILENNRKEGATIIKCSKENFLVETRRYFELVAEKNIRSKADTKEKLKVAKRRLLEMEKNKKNTARNLKLQQREVDSLTDKMT